MIRHLLRGALELAAGRFMFPGRSEVLAPPFVDFGTATVDAAILLVLLPTAASLACGNREVFSFADVLDWVRYMAVYGGRRCGALDRRVLLNFFRHGAISPPWRSVVYALQPLPAGQAICALLFRGASLPARVGRSADCSWALRLLHWAEDRKVGRPEALVAGAVDRREGRVGFWNGSPPARAMPIGAANIPRSIQN